MRLFSFRDAFTGRFRSKEPYQSDKLKSLGRLRIEALTARSFVILHHLTRSDNHVCRAGRTHEKTYLTDEAGIKRIQQHHLKL